MDYTFSEIVKVTLDDKIGCIVSRSKTYKSILVDIFAYINDYDKVKNLTSFNIKYDGKNRERGYHYCEKVGYSIQNCDSKRTLKEIIRLCTILHIKYSLTIRLQTNKVQYHYSS